MAGIKNDVVFAKNADFTAANNTSPAESNGLATNGQLWIGTTNVNVGGSHVNVGSVTSPDGSLSIGYSSPNITATVNRLVVTDLHVARFIVSAGGSPDGANYTTIASAYAAAVSQGGNQTVFIQPGTYTENLTLTANVNLTAFVCDSGLQGGSANVTIVGKLTFTAAGTVNITGIELKTNSDFLLAVTGSAASVVNLNNCNLNCTNNTGISYTSSSSSSQINLEYCTGNIGTTGIALYSQSSAGTLSISNAYVTNTGNSTTAFSNSAGAVNIIYSILFSPISTTSTGTMLLKYSEVNTEATNSTGLTFNGTGAGSAARHNRITSGSASSISIGTGAGASVEFNSVNSSNTNAITGAGTLVNGLNNFVTSKLINTSTQTATVTAFTPAISIGGSTTGITYTGQVGYYYQLGSIIYFSLHVVLSSKGAQVGNVAVTGFPVASGANGTNNNVGVTLMQNCTLTASYTTLLLQFNNSATTGLIYQVSPSAALANLTNTQITNTFEFAMNGFYFTN
jgi:hypothetical protein